MARALTIYQEKNPAVQRIGEMLQKAFEEIGERIRKDLIEAYRGYAKYRYEMFIKAIETRSGEIETTQRGWEFSDWHTYAKMNANSYSPMRTWDDFKKYTFTLTYRDADIRANDSYENARDSFVHKNLGKIREVLGSRSDLKNAVVKFDWRGGAFRGNLQVYLEGAYFRGAVDVKYVIRRIPNVTPYFQYPLVFEEAEISGTHYARPSEDELRVLLGGASREAYKKQREVQAAAEGWCPMSGEYAKDVPGRRMGRYRTCPSCGLAVSVSSGNKYLKHKTKEAQKASAAEKLTDAGYCPMSRQKVPAEIVAAIGPVEPYKDPKGFCSSCTQQVRLDAERDWIFTPGIDRPTQMRVKSAKYYKHKLK